MQRRGWGILIKGSLLLLVVTLALSVRSYWCGDWIGWARETVEHQDTRCRRTLGISWVRGKLCISFSIRRVTPNPGQNWPDSSHPWQWTTVSVPASRMRIPGKPTDGFALMVNLEDYITASNAATVLSHTALVLPHWFIALLSALLPAWHFYGHKRRLRRWRREHNLCLACGYDLRESLQRCPECGTANTLLA